MRKVAHQHPYTTCLTSATKLKLNYVQLACDVSVKTHIHNYLAKMHHFPTFAALLLALVITHSIPLSTALHLSSSWYIFLLSLSHQIPVSTRLILRTNCYHLSHRHPVYSTLSAIWILLQFLHSCRSNP